MLNLTDGLYSLFHSRDRATEEVRRDCSPITDLGDDKIWDLLGYYEIASGRVVLCENNIQNAANKIHKDEIRDIPRTRIYWALWELVRLHEHAHHLFFRTSWKNMRSHGSYHPFIANRTIILAEEGKRLKQSVSLKAHERAELMETQRNLLGVPIAPIKYSDDIIESLPQFATRAMMAGVDDTFREIFDAIDGHQPAQYRHWSEVEKEVKECEGSYKFSVPCVYNLSRVLGSPGHPYFSTSNYVIGFSEFMQALKFNRKLVCGFSKEIGEMFHNAERDGEVNGK